MSDNSLIRQLASRAKLFHCNTGITQAQMADALVLTSGNYSSFLGGEKGRALKFDNQGWVSREGGTELELQPLGAVVVLGSPESARVLEPADSEEVFLTQFAQEHFRLASV